MSTVHSCLHSVPQFLHNHLLIELRLQRFFGEDVKLHLPVAKEHGRFEHDKRLLQPIATGHHRQVDPELGWQHSLETPEFSRPPRKKKNRGKLLLNS